jgi:hypothetical protein
VAPSPARAAVMSALAAVVLAAAATANGGRTWTREYTAP